MTAQRPWHEPISSVEVFRDATEILRTPVVNVSRLDGANSVWSVEQESGRRVVMKYFSSTDHGRSHFRSELCVYQGNQLSPILAPLKFSDENRRLICIDGIEASDQPLFDFGYLLRQCLSEIPRLKVERLDHHHLPAILGTWEGGIDHLGPAERMILGTARGNAVIGHSVSRFVENWSDSCLIHGDLKLSNCILEVQHFRVIDWESVGFGPHEWDMAGLLQSAIVELVTDGPLSRWLEGSIQEIVKVVSEAPSELKDAIITRLLQSSLEATQHSVQVTRAAANILQCAEYVALANFQFLLGS